MTDKTYNGWTNYATWRIALEIFDGFDVANYYDGDLSDVSDLSKWLAEYADDVISENGSLEGLAVDYARAFLSDVNFYEIAEGIVEEIRAESDEEGDEE